MISLENEQVQENIDDLEQKEKYKLCKCFLYFFYGHSITISFNEYFIQSIHIFHKSLPELHYSILGFALFYPINLVICLVLIYALFVNKLKYWFPLWLIHFSMIFLYKLLVIIRFFKVYHEFAPLLITHKLNLNQFSYALNTNSTKDYQYCSMKFGLYYMFFIKLMCVTVIEIMALFCAININIKFFKLKNIQKYEQNLIKSEKNRQKNLEKTGFEFALSEYYYESQKLKI
jgi:hypothetical protein